MRTLKITLAALMIVTMAACSDGGDGGASTEVSDEGKPYADALSSSLVTDESGEIPLDQEQADCVAAKWVNIITPERLEENGFTPEKLTDPGASDDFNTLGISEDEAGGMVDGFGECDVNLRETFLASMNDDATTTDEEKACLDDAVTDDAIRQLLVTSLAAGDESEAADVLGEDFFQAILACSGGLDGLDG